MAFALARKVAGSYYPKNFTPEANTNKGVAGQQSAAFMSDYEMAMAALAQPTHTPRTHTYVWVAMHENRMS